MTAPEHPHDASFSDRERSRHRVTFLDVINTLSAYDEAILMDRLLNPTTREHAADHIFQVLREGLNNALAARGASSNS